MKQHSRFSSKEEQVTQQQSEHEAAREFAQSDELLRFDAAHTVLPPELEQRLAQSSAPIPPPDRRPWWKAWLGR